MFGTLEAKIIGITLLLAIVSANFLYIKVLKTDQKTDQETISSLNVFIKTQNDLIDIAHNDALSLQSNLDSISKTNRSLNLANKDLLFKIAAQPKFSTCEAAVINLGLISGNLSKEFNDAK